MNCPKCESKFVFSCTESTALKYTWKECFKCGYRYDIKNASEIRMDDEWMSENIWDEIYETVIDED